MPLPWSDCSNYCHYEGLGNCRSDSNLIPIPTLLFDHVQKIDRYYRMAMGHHKFNQVVVMIAAAVPDVISLLKAPLIPGKFLFSLLSVRTTKSSLLASRKASNMLSLSC